MRERERENISRREREREEKMSVRKWRKKNRVVIPQRKINCWKSETNQGSVVQG